MNEIMHRPDELQSMAKAMAKLFNKSPEDLFALMLIAQAENKHPAIAAQEYDIIQGRPALKSQATLARFQAAGGRIQWIKRDDTIASAMLAHPAGGELTITWTIERANKAGLTSKDNWKKFPAQMLSSRVVAEGVRALYPACLSGFYTSEEVADTDDRKPLNVAPQEQLEMAPAAKPKTIKQAKPEDVEDVKPEQQQEPAREVPAEYMARRQEIIKEVAAIVGAKDNPKAWSQEDKDLIGAKTLMDESKASLDIASMETLLLRAQIGQLLHGTTAWTSTMHEVIAMGHDHVSLKSTLESIKALAEKQPQQEPVKEAQPEIGKDLELY